MLYRFLIGIGNLVFNRGWEYLRDSANALSIECPQHIAETVYPHLVGYMFEIDPVSKRCLRFALFDDEASALLCELWYPRSFFSDCPPFANTIDEHEPWEINLSALPSPAAAPF